MSHQHDTRPLQAHVHTNVDLQVPTVRPVPGHPGEYLAQFCWDFSMRTTASQWDEIDTAVRAGIAACMPRQAVAL